MSKATVFGMLAIIAAVILAASALVLYQFHYWQLLEMQAGGVEHLGLQISMFEQPSIEMAIRAASFRVFPLTIPAMLKLATLVAGVGLIVSTQRHLAAMKTLIKTSAYKSKGHAGA